MVPKSAIRFPFHDMRSPFKKCSSHEGYVVPVSEVEFPSQKYGPAPREVVPMWVSKSAIGFPFHDMRSPFKKCSSHEGYVVPVSEVEFPSQKYGPAPVELVPMWSPHQQYGSRSMTCGPRLRNAVPMKDTWSPFQKWNSQVRNMVPLLEKWFQCGPYISNRVLVP